MNIKIDDNYSLTSDARNVMLIENKVVQDGKNKGKPTQSVWGYYGTVESALKGYAKLKTKLSNATTIPELLADIKKIDDTIESVLKGN